MNSKPFLIGITGGIGSGKTTVAKIFSILGIPIYFADDRAKWLMSNDPALKDQIQNSFGNNSYHEDGSLNREFIASNVFGNIENIKTINSLVHPAVKSDFEQWAKSQESPYVLKEAALLFETGSYKELDRVITVSSPLRIRINRVLLRDPHRNEEQLNAIIDQQMAEEEKIQLSDYVIKNIDNKLLIPQALKIHDKLLLLGKK
ncbi:dephospho-CoA kinase [Belliella sp. DSM 107340]|uniref:Dephospho-CoA kinase n=1 Tax=Belliella calami TaxID=2923436 RepID=A0ABS9ULV0_9BACT|nr:dephospho-CoA kinase [Belliella calami]MCH7397542.1 dephospho-CoA kinase [Belliella calami]